MTVLDNSSRPAGRPASLLTIFLIVFIDLMGFGILLPNQQYYGELFGFSTTGQDVFWLIMIGPAYSLFQFLFAPLLGRWSDRIGRRPVLIVSQAGTLFGFGVLYAAHYFTGPLAWVGITMLYSSRVIDGISGGNISTASAYIADITTPENRAKGMGLIGAAFGLGFIFGPLIGGLVGGHFGLQWVPVVAGVFSATALVMTIVALPESLTPESAKESAGRRWSLATLGHVLARPVIGVLVLMGFVNGFAFAGMEQTLSLLIQDRLGLAKENASKASGYLFAGIGVIIVLIQGGGIRPLIKRFGEVPLVIVGPLLIGAGLAVIGAGYPENQWLAFAIGCALLAIGSSLFNPSLQGLISRHAKASEQGEVLGAHQGMASLARAAGPMLAGYLYAAVSPGLPYFVAAGLTCMVALWAWAERAKFIPPREL